MTLDEWKTWIKDQKPEQVIFVDKAQREELVGLLREIGALQFCSLNAPKTSLSWYGMTLLDRDETEYNLVREGNFLKRVPVG